MDGMKKFLFFSTLIFPQNFIVHFTEQDAQCIAYLIN